MAGRCVNTMFFDSQSSAFSALPHFQVWLVSFLEIIPNYDQIQLGRVPRSAWPVDGDQALSPRWLEAEKGGARAEVGPRKRSPRAQRRGPPSNQRRLRRHVTGVAGGRGNLKWLTGCWRLAGWGRRRWGRSPLAGRPRSSRRLSRNVSARRGGPRSSLLAAGRVRGAGGVGTRRGRRGLRPCGRGRPGWRRWLREAPAGSQDVGGGRYPGQTPLTAPSLASASSSLEGVGPGQEFLPPGVSAGACACGERAHLFSCIFTEVVGHTALPEGEGRRALGLESCSRHWGQVTCPKSGEPIWTV